MVSSLQALAHRYLNTAKMSTLSLSPPHGIRLEYAPVYVSAFHLCPPAKRTCQREQEKGRKGLKDSEWSELGYGDAQDGEIDRRIRGGSGSRKGSGKRKPEFDKEERKGMRRNFAE